MKLTNYVNVFYGNGVTDSPEPEGIATAWHPIKPLTGNTTPAAILPFGKYSVCAFTAGYPCGYGNHRGSSTADTIPLLNDTMRARGFSHFHDSGTGAISVYYNYAVVTPYYGERQLDYGMTDIKATPGYYAVTLEETDIACELTVSAFAAYHRYHFTKPNGKISIDFTNDGLYGEAPFWLRGVAEEVTVKRVASDMLSASAKLQGVKLFFAVSFEGKGSLDESCSYVQKDVGSVTVKVSVSAVSENAAMLDNSKAVDSFDTAKANAERLWDEALSKIEIDCDEMAEKQIFYSNMYHSLTKPNDWNGGSWLWENGSLVVDFSTMWDIYKTELPLIFTLFKEVSEHIVDTFMHLFDAFGKFPNAFMISNMSGICGEQAQMLMIYSLYDAYKRGVSADWKEVFKRILAELKANNEITEFLETGKGECSSHTLDLAAGCATVLQFAADLGLSKEVEHLKPAVDYWKNVYDTETGLLTEEGRYYEGNHWTYSFRPMPEQHKVNEFRGGNNKVLKLLDKFFGFSEPENFEGRFEGFNNECDMETPYAYHYLGRNDRICEILDACDKYLYKDKNGAAGEGGLPGNNDSGGMTSCYIWNCLGLFPVSGQDLIFLSRPKFKKVVLKLSNGKTLTILKNGNGSVPKSVVFNKKTVDNFELTVSDVMSGGILEFNM